MTEVYDLEEKYVQSHGDLMDFCKEFGEESDRAAVILAAAKIDYLLQEILKKFLIPTHSLQDQFIDSDRALGTFSSRIQACFRLGLIEASFSKELDIFRRLRNEIAHEPTNCNFSTGTHKNRINELARPFELYSNFDELINSTFAKKVNWARNSLGRPQLLLLV